MSGLLRPTCQLCRWRGKPVSIESPSLNRQGNKHHREKHLGQIAYAQYERVTEAKTNGPSHSVA